MEGLRILCYEQCAQKLTSKVLNLHDHQIILKFHCIVDDLLVRSTFGLIHGLPRLFLCEVDHADA